MRGVGGNSAALGVQQGDAIRNITGELDRMETSSNSPIGSGALWSENHSIKWHGDIWSNAMGRVRFDASRVVPVANENRPLNMAVRYLIRARP